MLIDGPAIARLVPHAGEMCLLDGVLRWDNAAIRCVTGTHRSVQNPLRRNNRLGILCGVEYGAQAIALHAALAAQTTRLAAGRAGYLASLRDVTCHADRLDLLPGTLTVEAVRLHGDTDGAIYRFALSHADQPLISGRATVVLTDFAV